MQILKKIFKKKKTPFLPLYQHYVDLIKTGKILSESGNKFSIASINNYATIQQRFKLYEIENGTIYLEDINIQWANSLAVCLMEHGYTKNSIGNTLAVLKAMLNKMYKGGHSKFNGSGVICRYETTTAIYNSLNDIRDMLNLDLSNTDGYSRIRNAYIIHCFLGLRFKDFKKVMADPKAHIKIEGNTKFFTINTHKTKSEVALPISKIVYDLLQSFSDGYYKGITASYYNTSIKEIGRRAGLTQDVVFVRTEGGVRTETILKKYELMSSHTARRSFATNATLLGLQKRIIMQMTGHKTEEAFDRYVRCSPIENAITLANHQFFNLELPLPIMLGQEKTNLIEK